jgi:hypothetical protein
MAPVAADKYEWGNTAPAIGVDLQYWKPDDACDIFLQHFIRYGGKDKALEKQCEETYSEVLKKVGTW